MASFDPLSRRKSSPATVGGDFDIAKNTKKHPQKDIWKRTDMLQVSPRHEFVVPYPSWIDLCRDLLGDLIQGFAILSLGRWVCIIMITSLAGVIYTLGLMVRTESRIHVLAQDPWLMMQPLGRSLVRQLDQDFRVVGIVAENPFFPIEPLASGVRAVRALDHIVMRLQASPLHTAITNWIADPLHVSALPLMDRVSELLDGTGDDIATLRSTLVRFVGEKHPIIGYIDTLDRWKQDREIWYSLLGRSWPVRILVLNQNSEELRAGGGFPGTAFIIQIRDGKIETFDFYDIYKLDYFLTGYRTPPEGFKTLRSKRYPGKPMELEIRDANYFPTLHESAGVLARLTEEAGFGKIDLVVGINEKLLEDIVATVEPITLPGISVPLDHTNITTVLSLLVEGKVRLYWHFKDTVGKLGHIVLDTVRERGVLDRAALIVLRHLTTGEITVASPREDFQQALDHLDLFDRWRGQQYDWVYPLFTSLSGNKSDRLMERTFTVDHLSRCDRELTLTQRHLFDIAERARLLHLTSELGLTSDAPRLLTVQGESDNYQYLRFILPPGTRLVQSDVFHEYAQTQLHATLDGYVRTKPSETMHATLRYTLPEGYCSDETRFFKQPGLRNTHFIVEKWGKRTFQQYYE